MNFHQHQNDSRHIWRYLIKYIVSSCNLRYWLIFLNGRFRTYRVASLHAGPVGRILYNMYLRLKLMGVFVMLVKNKEYVFIVIM